MLPLRHVVNVLLALLALAAPACGRDVSIEPGAGGDRGTGGGAISASGAIVSSTAASVSASSGTGTAGGSCPGGSISQGDACIPPCPAVEPSDGSSCDVANERCEYSDELEIDCRRRLLCDPATCAWRLEDTMTSCGPTSMDACPPIAAGSTCDIAQACHYADGSLCWCAPEGLTCDHDPGDPCPAVAPRLGSPCDTEGTNCSYGKCAPYLEAARQCCGGVWGWGYGNLLPC